MTSHFPIVFSIVVPLKLKSSGKKLGKIFVLSLSIMWLHFFSVQTLLTTYNSLIYYVTDGHFGLWFLFTRLFRFRSTFSFLYKVVAMINDYRKIILFICDVFMVKILLLFSPKNWAIDLCIDILVLVSRQLH